MPSRAVLILTTIALSIMITACLNTDDDRVGTKCGNGIVEGYEECDGDDFYYSNCYHFMPEEARSTWDTQTQRLKCNPDCTIDASECLYCGDGRLDPEFEDCDNETLGGASCDLVWSGGGALTCSLF